MNTKYLFICFLINFTFAQVGVGTTTPNGALEVNSTTQGLVMPRVSLTSSIVAAPVVNPNGGALLSGTMVYNTVTAGTSPNNVIPGFYFWDGSKWVLITSQANPSNPDWTISGNTGTTAGTHFIGTTDAVDFVARTNNTERVRVKATGEVGIGTTAPSGKLDVTDNNPSGLTRSRFYNAGATSRQDINIGAGGAGNLYLGVDVTGGIFGAGAKSYFDNRSGGRMVFGSNGNEYATLAIDGKFGIGINAPTSKFYVSGPSGNSVAEISNTIAGNTTDCLVLGINNCGGACAQGTSRNLVLYNKNGSNANFGSLSFVSSTISTDIEGASIVGVDRDITNHHAGLSFFTRNATDFASRLIIRSSGDVGIGTTSPSSRLAVFDNGSSSSNVFSIGNNAGVYNFHVANNFNNANYGSGAADYQANGYSNVLVMNLGGNGRFVFGDHIGPWSDAQYDVGASFARWRTIYASNGTINTSDARVKANIKEVPYGLSTVMKMKPVIYDKYNGFDKTGESVEEVGLLAQELKELVPNAVVGYGTDKNPMGIYYAQLIPVLIKAIQEQNDLIEDLKTKNKQLESVISKTNILEERIANIEERVKKGFSL